MAPGESTFCIEQSRWSAGTRGVRFGSAGTAALSPKSVRMSGKVSRSQSGVWDNVARKKSDYSTGLGSSYTNSSLNEALDSDAVRDATEAYEKALVDLPRRHSDTVGAVFIVDARIEEVDVYPGHNLFAKVYPRLLQSLAADAAHSAAVAKRADPLEPPSLETVGAFLTGQGESVRSEELDAHNRLDVVDLGTRYRLQSHYQDLLVHEQLMAKEPQG